mmetsp:Transcript_25178/g.72190  ORF Transcript_25178/g.72190 Transcript_25178/m.72190 type:complete len:281 (-) Transcript_25178:56-898(-)
MSMFALLQHSPQVPPALRAAAALHQHLPQPVQRPHRQLPLLLRRPVEPRRLPEALGPAVVVGQGEKGSYAGRVKLEGLRVPLAGLGLRGLQPREVATDVRVAGLGWVRLGGLRVAWTIEMLTEHPPRAPPGREVAGAEVAREGVEGLGALRLRRQLRQPGYGLGVVGRGLSSGSTARRRDEADRLRLLLRAVRLPALGGRALVLLLALIRQQRPLHLPLLHAPASEPPGLAPRVRGGGAHGRAAPAGLRGVAWHAQDRTGGRMRPAPTCGWARLGRMRRR